MSLPENVIPFPVSRTRSAPLSKKQLAKLWGVSTRYLEIQQRDNGLPFHRLPNGFCRYTLGEVEDWRAQREAS